ncbi:MAG: hypothetical protein GY796_25140 [Chloroflexi bacterium]|nr:hypothetical protein [Chloroflexota bacterium]
MNMVTVFKALGPIDGRNIRRDSMLRWAVFAPVLIALIFRWLLPWVTEGIEVNFGFDLRPYYPLIYAYLILICPVLYGVVIGFLLLDERDDRTLTALRVTPMSLNNYTAYRLTVPLLIGIILAPLILWLAHVPGYTVAEIMLVAVTAAPLAPIYTLFLAAFAPNKVQGFAMMKATGIFLIAPLLAWFIEIPWQLLFGIFPTYWPIKVFWLAGSNEPGILFFAAAGIIYQLIIIYALLRRFNKKMGAG